jgi:hypothetical protein
VRAPVVPVAGGAVGLLRAAEQRLAEARAQVFSADRFVGAHLAALRGTAAVLAARARPVVARRGPRSAWELLPRVAPELAEWAMYFAAGAAKRAAAEAGLPHAVTAREADDLVRATETFLELVGVVLAAAARQSRAGVMPARPSFGYTSG